MVYNMGFIISIPLGIILGYLVYKISLKNQLLAYLIGILPYSIFYFLTLENKENDWGHYRAIAFFATIIGSIVWIVISKCNERKNGNVDAEP